MTGLQREPPAHGKRLNAGRHRSGFARPGGETAIQIVMLDLASRTRTQVTRLPYAVPARTVPYEQAVMFPRFVDDDTILFVLSANPDGLNPEGAYTFFTADTDGTGLRAIGTPIASEGSRIDPRFRIAGGGTNLMNMAVVDGSSLVFQDVFLLDGKRLLQLTDFRRPDTGRRFLTADRRRVFFAAAADPLGTNPSGNCQLFSIDYARGPPPPGDPFPGGRPLRERMGLRPPARV